MSARMLDHFIWYQMFSSCTKSPPSERRLRIGAAARRAAEGRRFFARRGSIRLLAGRAQRTGDAWQMRLLHILPAICALCLFVSMQTRQVQFREPVMAPELPVSCALCRRARCSPLHRWVAQCAFLWPPDSPLRGGRSGAHAPVFPFRIWTI